MPIPLRGEHELGERRQTGPRDDRWRAHPVQSALIRGAVFLVPFGAGLAVVAVLARAVPRPAGLAVAGWFGLLLGASTLAAAAVERLARRFLPLAVLLQLSLVFPDEAPSRYALARTAGNVHRLRERVQEARERGVEDAARTAETILSLVAALSAHDRKTRGHSERVRVYTDLLADAMGLREDDRDRLRWGSLLHDIGKLHVSAGILNKPGKPTEEEWAAIRAHPDEGVRLARPLLAWLGPWGEAILDHHERYDGGGYPHGKAADDISLAGRIVAVADSFEVMTAARTYKRPMGVTAARRELAACAGGQFDPAVVRAFLNVSLGRLKWTVGPASWIAHLPFLGGIQRAGSQAVVAVKSATVVAAFGVAGALNTAFARGAVAALAPPGQEAGGTEVTSDPSIAPIQQPTASPSTAEDGTGRDGGKRSEDKGDDGRNEPAGDPSPSPTRTSEPSPDPVREVTEPVRETVEDVTDTVDEVGGTVGETVGSIGGRLGETTGGLLP